MIVELLKSCLRLAMQRDSKRGRRCSEIDETEIRLFNLYANIQLEPQENNLIQNLSMCFNGPVKVQIKVQMRISHNHQQLFVDLPHEIPVK